MHIYRELDRLRHLFAEDIPPYNPFIELRLELESPNSELEERISLILQLLVVGLTREQDKEGLKLGILRFLVECRTAFDSDWQRQARIFLFLHEVAMRLEAEDLWRSKDRGSFGHQDHIESILTNHLKKLSSFGIIRRIESCGPRGQSKRSGRQRFVPGCKVWRDPYHLIRMRKTLLTATQDDVDIHDGFALLGVSKLKSFPTGFGNMMIRDLDSYVQQVRATWLRDYRENQNQVRARLEAELRCALRDCQAAQSRKDKKEIAAAFKNVERIWNLGAEPSAKAAPHLPLVLLDFEEMA